jgi:hypothetical protein
VIAAMLVHVAQYTIFHSSIMLPLRFAVPCLVLRVREYNSAILIKTSNIFLRKLVGNSRQKFAQLQDPTRKVYRRWDARSG